MDAVCTSSLIRMIAGNIPHNTQKLAFYHNLAIFDKRLPVEITMFCYLCLDNPLGKSYAIIMSMLRRNEPVYQQIVKIASTFGVFDCIPCSRAIKQLLVERGISGKQIELDTGSQDPIYGRIYDDSVGQLITTTGHHEGIAVDIDGEEIVFDNLHPEGLPRIIWRQNLYSPILEVGREFQITEIDF